MVIQRRGAWSRSIIVVHGPTATTSNLCPSVRCNSYRAPTLLLATGDAIRAASPASNGRGFWRRIITTGAAALFLCDEERATSERESQSEQCDFFHGENPRSVSQARGRRKR